MGKIPCTVAVLTKNNEATLKRALESAKEFAEIIVVDGGSTDRTLDIARAYGAKIIPQDPSFKDGKGRIKDFAGVHNQALHASSFDWHFYLDSDEVLTSELVHELISLIRAQPKSLRMSEVEIGSTLVVNGGIRNEAVVWVDRKYEIEGKVIGCAATYPTRQMRFFHKNAVTGFIKPIHERINPKPGAVIKKTQSFMLVPVSADPRVWREKWKHYIELEVARRGKISFNQWFLVCLENLKISLLYAIRLIRNSLFGNGMKMPFALEWERHVYHFNLCKALFANLKS